MRLARDVACEIVVEFDYEKGDFKRGDGSLLVLADRYDMINEVKELIATKLGDRLTPRVRKEFSLELDKLLLEERTNEE